MGKQRRKVVKRSKGKRSKGKQPRVNWLLIAFIVFLAIQFLPGLHLGNLVQAWQIASQP